MVPYNINPLKFVSACVGVVLRGRDDRELMISAVLEIGKILGFTEAETMRFWEQSQGTIVGYVKNLLSSPANLLMLDEKFLDAQQTLASWFRGSEAQVKELATRFEAFLEARAIVPIRELGPLAQFILQTWTIRKFTDPASRLIVGEAYLSVLSLLIKRPRETCRALYLWRPFPDEFESAGRHTLQIHGEIAYNATNRLSTPDLTGPQ